MELGGWRSYEAVTEATDLDTHHRAEPEILNACRVNPQPCIHAPSLVFRYNI